jgi:hypothetical protein
MIRPSMAAHKAKLDTMRASCIKLGKVVKGWRKAAANGG